MEIIVTSESLAIALSLSEAKTRPIWPAPELRRGNPCAFLDRPGCYEFSPFPAAGSAYY